MKPLLKIVLLLFFSSCFFSCSHPSGTQKTESGSDFLKNNPGYNPDSIDPKAPVVEINLSTSGNTMADMKFNSDSIIVKEGTTIKLILKNGSIDMAMMHNFVLIDPEAVQQVADAGVKAGKDHDFVPEMPSVYVHTKMTSPGEICSILFPAPQKGIYRFICTYPGHYSKMNGVFLVE